MHLKLTRGVLIGNQWHESGSIVTAEGKLAESFVRSGAAVPITPPAAVELATAPRPAERATAPRPAERATAPRQR